MTIERADKRTLVLSLGSTLCPACGRPKKAGMSLCYADFMSLPASFKKALYQRVGQGYEGAMVDAFARLNKTVFHAAPAGGRAR